MTGSSVSDFYNDYWPANVPDYEVTEAHVRSLLPDVPIARVLDAGCGTGVCSLALAAVAGKVTAVDISSGSLATAKQLADGLGRSNIAFQQADILELPFDSGTFDLVWSWGVIHHTLDPDKAFQELVRVLAPGGLLVLAVYRRTALTPFHEAVRRRCLGMEARRKQRFLGRAARLTDVYSTAVGRRPLRDDNSRTVSKIEDWYFVPEKHFYSIPQTRQMFAAAGLTFELAVARTGRFKSTSNIIVRGTKRQ